MDIDRGRTGATASWVVPGFGHGNHGNTDDKTTCLSSFPAGPWLGWLGLFALLAGSMGGSCSPPVGPDDPGQVDPGGDPSGQDPIDGSDDDVLGYVPEPNLIIPNEITVYEGDAVVIDASDSYSPRRVPLRFQWLQTAGPAISLYDPQAATLLFFAPQVHRDTAMEVMLTAEDGTATASKKVTIWILDSLAVTAQLEQVTFSAESGLGDYAFHVWFDTYTRDGTMLPEGDYTWYFGDGQSEKGHSLKHVYESEGDYLVTLCVSWADTDPWCEEQVVEIRNLAVEPTPSGPGVVEVTPQSPFAGEVLNDDCCATTRKEYILTNSGGTILSWQAFTAEPPETALVTIEPATGMLSPGQQVPVTVAISDYAATLEGGYYGDAVIFENVVSKQQQIRGVSIMAGQAGVLMVTPDEPYFSTGPQEGSFQPASRIYTLSNPGHRAIVWSAEDSLDWLDIIPSSGNILPGESSTIIVSLNSTAATLAASATTYSGTITFTNETNQRGNTTRTAALWVTEYGHRAMISQHGITWTFDRPYPAGQFINGDWFVLPRQAGGTVTVTRVDPAPTGSGSLFRNGSVVNPMPGNDQGYDGRAAYYNPALSAVFPLTLQPSSERQSLVSTISRQTVSNPGGEILYPSDVLEAIAVLTILEAEPPADHFRPAFPAENMAVFDAAQP